MRSNKLRFVVISLILFCCGCARLSVPPEGNDIPPAQWRVITDSGWPAASSGKIEYSGDAGSLPVELKYSLKKTREWQWPEIEFRLEFPNAVDLSGFSSLEARLNGPAGEEMYLVVEVEDKGTGRLKPCICRIRTTGSPRNYSLPFSAFRISPDWTVRNPGYSSAIEWKRVRAVGVHKKGADGSDGVLKLERLELSRSGCRRPYDIEKERGGSPAHYFVFLPQGIKEDQAAVHVEIFSGSGKKRTVSRYLYGVNLASWLDLPDEDKVKALKPGLLRLGGNFLDRYSWRSGIYTFPGSSSPVRMFSLDRFVKFCSAVGSAPLIQVNALGLFGEDRIDLRVDEEAGCMVRYLNGERGYGVKFFEIGNEPFVWHLTHYDFYPFPCSAEEYAGRLEKISRSMRLAQESCRVRYKAAGDIKIFAPAISTSWQGWRDCAGGEKSAVEELLSRCVSLKKENGGKPPLDVLSFHLFNCFAGRAAGNIPDNTVGLPGYTAVWWQEDYISNYDLAFTAGEKPAVLPRFRRWIDRYLPGLELAVTEFNIESASMVNYDMLWKVLYLGDLYGILAEQGVDYAAQFCLNSSDQNIAMLDDTGKRTALYYPFQLYSNYFSGMLMEKKVTPSRGVSAYAVRHMDDYTVIAVNKAAEERDTEFVIRKDNGGNIRFRGKLPALSLSCIRLEGPDHKKAEVWEYGRAQIN
ncbi:MAG: glycoside hydrolase family 44 protein [Candidatus Omnitrophota bacterium]